MVLILGVLLGPDCARAQSTETQQLSLEQGENFVSLRVQPEDASLSTIFQGHLDQIHRVKDEQGRVYMPGDGIEQFTTWDPDESYKVYTTGSFSVEVTGTPSSLTTATVPLEKGGNLIPFVPADPQAVDDALASVSGTLLRVEGEDDQIYEPGGTPSSLDSLRAGQGYVLYVNQPDTLTYTIQTATLMEALGLEEIEAGQYIRARGRDEPGDGGGGMFVVTNSGTRTDGGTVFMFEDDLTQVVEATSIDHTNLSWRSVEVRYGDDASKDVIHNRQLSGFHAFRSSEPTPWIDLVNGSVRDFGWSPFSTLRDNTDGSTLYYTYKHTNSSRRLERMGVTNSVKPEWWGADKAADLQSPKEQDPELRWAMVVANRLFDNGNYDWTYVDLNGIYYFQNTLALPGGVTFRGVGPTDIDSGMPQKYQDSYTRAILRLLPNEALFYRKTNYDEWADPDRERVHNTLSGMGRGYISNSHAPEKLQPAHKVKIDGNVRNNMQVFNNLGDYAKGGIGATTWLQDSGDWNGFYSVGNSWPDGMPFDMQDVNMVDLGSSGLSTGNNSHVANMNVDNVGVYDARRNHNIYGTVGTVENVTVEGQFWGAAAILADPRGTDIAPTYKNVTVKNIERGQFFYNTIFQVRGLGENGGPFMLDGFDVDLSDADYTDSQLVVLSSLTDKEVTYKNGTIRGYTSENYSGAGDPHILKQSTKTGAVDGSTTLENVTVIDEGQQFELMNRGGAGGNRSRRVRIIDFEYKDAEGFTRTSSSRYALSPVKSASSSDEPRAWRYYFENFKWTSYLGRGFVISADDGDHPLDWYVTGGEINNHSSFDRLVNSRSSSGRVGRLFLHNFSNLDMGRDDRWEANWHKDLRPGGPGRMRDVTNREGQVSDNSGTYTATSTDESNGYALIETNLLSRAWEKSVTANAGYNVTGVEIANSDGTLRGDNNEGQYNPYLKVSVDGSITQGDTFAWTARVTPLDAYSTSGLFVARKISDKSYTSGNGPFTYDLRGVASSQESGEKIIYTASSGDTSVVTASVQGDDYTLELTEQGTGTATITVTGEISGIGTTTTTFEVTVE